MTNGKRDALDSAASQQLLTCFADRSFVYVRVYISMYEHKCVRMCSPSLRLMSAADGADITGDSLSPPRLPKLCVCLIANDTI